MRRWVLMTLLAAAVPAWAQSTGDAHRAVFTDRLVAAAVARAGVHVRYVPDYVRIPYPGGDVPADTGTCADEIVRIYRAVGVDLQKLVHEDIAAAWDDYPHKWGAKRPDKNIDHRRVPNLMVFFRRHGESLATSRQASDYAPGDIVTWNLVKDG